MAEDNNNATEEVTDGAPDEEIIATENTEKVEEKKENENKGISEEELQKILEERDRKWQSRFDKVLREKKTQEEKAMTVEERMAKLEEERQQERLSWARKEAKAKAQIQDDLDEAVRKYTSNDPEEISEGADAIRTAFDSTVAEYTKRIEELEKQLKYGSKPPAGGGKGESEVMSKEDFNNLSPREQNAYITKGGKIEE